MSYPEYESYKDSGIEWLGDIPGGWEVGRFSNVYRSRMGATILASELQDNGRVPVMSATESETVFGYIDHPKIMLGVDDLIIPARGNSIGHVKIVKFPCTSTQTTILSTNLGNAYPKFINYFLNGLREVLFYFDQTAIPQITVQQVSSNKVLLPPIVEQKAIADFLDEKTAQIDQLIKKKEKLLELLAEKRTALITRAVTKGLDPTAPMKPSGIEWLGDVPEGWKVMALRYLADPIIGLTYSPENVVGEDEGNLVLRASNIQKGKLSVKPQSNVFVDAEIPEKLRLLENDILVCSRNGSRKLIGKNALIKQPEAHWTFGAFTTVLRGEQNEFLYWVLNSLLFEFQSARFLTSTINQLTTGTFKSLEIPVPPFDEQAKIIQFLKGKTKQIDKTISTLRAAIKRLKEYRSALITNAVTGKIKVT